MDQPAPDTDTWTLTVTLAEHGAPSIAVSVFGHLTTAQVGVLSAHLDMVRRILDAQPEGVQP